MGHDLGPRPLRPRRRGRPRRAPARAPRAALRAQRPEPEGDEVLERGGRASTSPARCATASSTTPAPGARPLEGPGRAADGPGRLRQPRHRGRAAAPGSCRPDLPATRSPRWATGSRRLRPRLRRRGGEPDEEIRQTPTWALRPLRGFMFRNVYLLAGRPEAERAGGACGRSSAVTRAPRAAAASPEPDLFTRVTDFVGDDRPVRPARLGAEAFMPREGPSDSRTRPLFGTPAARYRRTENPCGGVPGCANSIEIGLRPTPARLALRGEGTRPFRGLSCKGFRSHQDKASSRPTENGRLRRGSRRSVS